MPWMALAFLTGSVLFQRVEQLPPWPSVAMGLVLVVLAAFVRGWRWWVFLPFGWLWAGAFALWNQVPSLPVGLIGETIEVRLTVAGLPKERDGITRFPADIKSTASKDPGSHRVSLTWRNSPELRAGQAYRAQVRLKPAHSYRNPGSWDYAGWLYRQGIRYRGYVVDRGWQFQGDSSCCLLDRLRQSLRDRLFAVEMPAGGRALLLALVLGDRSEMTREMRETAAVTGVSHLLAISGLHISLIGGLAALVFGWLWRHTSWCQRMPAVLAGAIAGLVVAGLYAALSGFGLPARRALLMLAVAVFILTLRRAWTPWQIFSVVLIGLLLVQPDAVLEAGLWLSFTAVAAILALLPRLRGRSWWIALITLQVGISLALYPVLLAFDMQTAPLGIFFNLVMVPLFSLLLIPAALLAVVSFLAAPGLVLPLQWIGESLDWIWSMLDWVVQWSSIRVQRPGSSIPTLICLGLAVVLLLAGPGVQSRLAGIVLFAIVHFPKASGIPEGGFRLDVLDVGQGLAAVIETRTHRLLFDTGAAYPSGFNLADAVVLPWLWRKGTNALDVLVLSHGDNDHAGAAGRLDRRIDVKQVFSGEPSRVEVAAEVCPGNYFWRWDGVRFGFIQPNFARRLEGNDASCVLLVKGRWGSVLLTGDAGKRIERALLGQLQEMEPLDVVVAGHHGSATSSSAEFVRAVRSSHVVYSVGYRNRYGFPREQVDRRWAEAGAERWRTDGCGQIGFDFTSLLEGSTVPEVYAPANRRYWEFPDVPCEVTTSAPSSMIDATFTPSD